MRKIISKIMPAFNKDVISEIACDWCGEVMYQNGIRTSKALHSSIVDDEWFELEYTKGCGEGTHLIVDGWKIEDLCHDCIPRLRKLLEDTGIKLTEIDL